jgi:steroid 5-alpha reductase family enzyme
MKLTGLLHMTLAYVVTLGVGWITLLALGQSPIWDMFWADIAATVAIFIFSRLYKNSSFYDAYWSVVPPLIALYWALEATAIEATAIEATAVAVDGTRAWLVIVLVWLWGIRLTVNWATYWPGLEHEDWRYGPIKTNAGKWNALADFSAIHLFPTVIVFVACLPIYAAVAMDARPLNWLDYVAAAVTALAIIIELLSDIQLHRFLAHRKEGEIMKTGLWAYSRHPNYFGEWLFWAGLALFGIAAVPSAWWWVLPGSVAMLVMFLVASIPMIDKRSVERRPEYEAHMARVSGFVPWFPKTGA